MAPQPEFWGSSAVLLKKGLASSHLSTRVGAQGERRYSDARPSDELVQPDSFDAKVPGRLATCQSAAGSQPHLARRQGAGVDRLRAPLGAAPVGPALARPRFGMAPSVLPRTCHSALSPCLTSAIVGSSSSARFSTGAPCVLVGSAFGVCGRRACARRDRRRKRAV